MHTTDFVLHGGDTAFANRQKLLFDSLSDAEQECNKNKMVTEPSNKNTDVDKTSNTPVPWIASRRRGEMRRFSGKESIFKRPEIPVLRTARRTIPDYHRNPHKWVKYSLDDVSNEDLTDESNTRAALSFLKELKKRKSLQRVKETKKMDIDEIAQTEQEQEQDKLTFKSRTVKTATGIRFKKPENELEETQNTPVVIDPENKPMFRNSKVIMPEYIVGQKQKKKNKKEKPVEKVDRLKQLKLGHLEEPDEEES
ncbi:uncharacterized protein LOC143186658 [Calliopsis andreniformis]|uniref:uncharacterized protein LOC143186658 n=1 Tax=Calliopsis andreniformis TaxID=337506 RepID=UPI003FCCE836